MNEIKLVIEKGLIYFGIGHRRDSLESLDVFIRELARWNRRVNLTGMKREKDIVERLLYDAFFLYGCLEGANRILDMGSGSGILSIPIAVLSAHGAVFPGGDREGVSKRLVFSVDKSLRKIQFQRHIKRMIGLDGFVPIHGRIEDIAPLGVDVLAAKAFGNITSILSSGAKHMKTGGRVLILKGMGEESVHCPGFPLLKEEVYSLPSQEKRNRLFVYGRSSD